MAVAEHRAGPDAEVSRVLRAVGGGRNRRRHLHHNDDVSASGIDRAMRRVAVLDGMATSARVNALRGCFREVIIHQYETQRTSP